MAELDRETRAYLNDTKAKIAVKREDSNTMWRRPDMQKAYRSASGRKIRIALENAGRIARGREMPENMKRAIAACALWVEWKEAQAGRPLSWDEVPEHARPVKGAIIHPMPALYELAM